jgi:putative transposase
MFHVINRGNDRRRIFDDGEYARFEHLMAEARARVDMRVLAYCLMPNHWHLVLWPRVEGDMARFTGWSSQVHAQRRHRRRNTTGHGHLYQDRYRAFRIDGDEHLLTVMRYVERNPVKPGLVGRVEDWRWSSAWRRVHGDVDGLLSQPRTPLPDNWIELTNATSDAPTLAELHGLPPRGRPPAKKGTVPVSDPGKGDCPLFV